MNEGLPLASDAEALLRAAARELLPVVIDLGPEQARFSTFVSAVEHDQVVLSPVAAAHLPPRRGQVFRIVPAAGPQDFYVTATSLEPDGALSARVGLSQTRVLPRPQPAPEARVESTDLLVLVIVGGLDEGSSYVFPIERIGADTCEIRASVALLPGRELTNVEVIGDRRLLRRASAEVLETIPYYLPDGGKTFLTRLSLHDEPSVESAQAYDLVTDAAQVKRLLGFMAMTQARGSYQTAEHGTGSSRLLEVGKDAAWVELQPMPAFETERGMTLRLGFPLFATSYEFDVRPLQLDAAKLQTSLPLILRRYRRHRREHRVRVASPHEVLLHFRNPITGREQNVSVSEVSFFGLAFSCTPQDLTPWTGLPLEHARLGWNGHVIALGDLTVEESAYDPKSEHTHCTASIEHSAIADDEHMISLLATLAHPHVRVHDGGDFSSLHQIYLKAGLFGPHMERNLAPIIDQTRDVWKKLHSGATSLVRTFVHGPKHAPDAAVTVMRAWEHAWVVQHFVDVGSQMRGATGRLQTALLDHLVPRPDARHLLFFVKSDNRLMNAYLHRFFDEAGTPDAVTRTVVELWSKVGDETPQRARASTGWTRRADQPADADLVSRAAQRCFGVRTAAALSMLPGEIGIPDTSARFARAGLMRSRTCEIVERDGKPVYAVLEEQATPGMNLTWMINSCWILPTQSEPDTDGSAFDAALRCALERSAQSATGERFLNLPEGLDAARLKAFGFTKEGVVYLYVVSRAGLHRLFHYATSRYGELTMRSSPRALRNRLPA